MTRKRIVKKNPTRTPQGLTDASGLRGLSNPSQDTAGLDISQQRRSTNFVDVGETLNPNRRVINVETRPRSRRRAPGVVIGRDVGRRGATR